MDNDIETTEEYTNGQFAKDLAKAAAVAAAPYVTFVVGRYIYRKVQARKNQETTQTED